MIAHVNPYQSPSDAAFLQKARPTPQGELAWLFRATAVFALPTAVLDLCLDLQAALNGLPCFLLYLSISSVVAYALTLALAFSSLWIIAGRQSGPQGLKWIVHYYSAAAFCALCILLAARSAFGEHALDISLLGDPRGIPIMRTLYYFAGAASTAGLLRLLVRGFEYLVNVFRGTETDC